MVIVRSNPDTPCQPEGVHHPHRYECDDSDCCDGVEWEDGKWLGDQGLWCCVCGQTWPCDAKREGRAAP